MTALAPPNLRLAERLAAADGIGLCVARDDQSSYLVVSLPGRAGPCWICAPASPQALDCVREHRASPWSIIHHTTTGTITVFRTLIDGTVRESVMLCADLPAGAAVLCAA